MVLGARTKIAFKKPIAVGFSILEISKFIMYSFYYDHRKAKYGDRCTLLFTNTDSSYCEIWTDDLYAGLINSLGLYDTSNFDRKLPQYNDDNRRELGKCKTETGSVPPPEFVGLRAKMYSLQAPTKIFKKAKGIQKHYVRKHVRHENFLEVLRKTRRNTNAKFCAISSVKHEVNTVEVTKLCLCAFDDKRSILDDGVHTWAYGNNSIN